MGGHATLSWVSHPEVVDPSHQRLVAVDYIVPAKFVEDASGKVVRDQSRGVYGQAY